MNRLTTWLSSGRFAGNVMKLLSGSLAAQVLVVASSPILTRLYSASDFGAFGVYVSLIALCTTVATLRYQMAIVSASRAVAQYLQWAVFGFVTIFSLALGVLLSVAPSRLLAVMPSDEYTSVLWLLPIGVFTHSLSLGMMRIGGKQNVFGRLAIALIVGRVVDLAIKLTTADALGWVGLSVGMIAGDAFIVVMLASSIGGWSWRPPRDLRGYLGALGRYRNFPFYNLPTTLSSSLSNGLPVLALAFLFDPAVAGLFELARRVLGRPSSVVGNRFYTVFYQRSVDALKSGGSIADMVEQLIPLFLMLFAPLFLVVALFGAELFAFVFGKQWVEAGRYAAALAPAWYLRSVAAPIRVFNTFERQSLDLRWQLGLLMVTVLSFAIGYRMGDPYVCVVILSLATTLAYALHLVLTIHLSGASYAKIFRRLISPVRLISDSLKL